MRLINAKTLEPEIFENETDRPKYAILSHRWVDRQEVSLYELTSRLNESKSGWQKIRFCCDEALKYNLEWVWVDTCCIDKMSSAELTEAINSMYRWYRSADVCFAHLSDASKASEKSFRDSIWFTRSWTLQELLAPDNLRFYDASFQFMGTKIANLAILQSITNIPEHVLKDPDKMYERPIAHQMNWAAKRTATRVEDIAYSLFGIFEVNLPLIYGEGARAFNRLQQEIIWQSDDQSIFIWTSPGHGLCPCFAASPADFGYSGLLYPGAQNNEFLENQARPYTLTNVGLQMECKMIQCTYRIWLALLPWSSWNGSNDEDQFCFFLSQSQDRSNVWHRVKLQNRASCTLREAIEIACHHSSWLRQTDLDPKGSSTEQGFKCLMDRYPALTYSVLSARCRAHWRSIYVDLCPRTENLDSDGMLHGIVLDMPSLFEGDDPKMRSFALVSNFEWKSPANPNPGLNSRYTYRTTIDGFRRLGWERSVFDWESKDISSRPSLLVSHGVFALHPLQPGPAGALFFEPSRLGLKGLVLGFDQAFQLTAVFISKNAEVNVGELYQWAFPFARLEDFKCGFFWGQAPGARYWLTPVLRRAFQGRSDKQFPDHVYIEHEDRSMHQYNGPHRRRPWLLKASHEKFDEGGKPYLRCWIEEGDDDDSDDSETCSQCLEDNSGECE